MENLTETKSTAESPAEQLLKLKDQVFQSWLTLARKQIEPANRMDDATLTDHWPTLFDCIAQALEDEKTDRVYGRSCEFARVHGSERARLSDFNPDDLVQEYYLYCQIICDILGESMQLRARHFHVIHETVCIALREAMIAYSEVQTTFRERFIATLTHDLRNPIAAAKMAAELIDISCEDPTEVSALAERLKTNLKRADHMLQSLLDVAYMHSGKQVNYRMERFDLKEVAFDIVQEFKLTYGNRFHVRGEHIDGYWNKSAICRAIENLVSNAIKYGSSEKPIVVELSKYNEHARIRVHNEGRPIPYDDQKRIFQPFKRETSVLEAKEGWGLGLCYVQTAAEAHGGKVEVQSDDTHGTDFFIEIPLDSRH